MIQPIAESLNLESLKLDFNQLGHAFVVKLCERMLQNKLQHSFGRSGGSPEHQDNSFISTDSNRLDNSKQTGRKS